MERHERERERERERKGEREREKESLKYIPIITISRQHREKVEVAHASMLAMLTYADVC
jgi:hypothetical protein